MKKKEKIGKLKKKNFKKKRKKKEKREKLAKKTKKKNKEESTVDYCCNPQCFVCGGNSDSPTPFKICCNSCSSWKYCVCQKKLCKTDYMSYIDIFRKGSFYTFLIGT
jgi:hypothetical protein